MTPDPDLADGHSTASAAMSSNMMLERRTPLDPHTEVLMAVSLSFGLLSTCATAFAFYWFVKMKRKFRHDLIMLLVQADFVKSAGFIICPIIQFWTDSMDQTSRFCQFVGFIMAMGIEASDVAVLLIAVHSAMYILRPRSGLYPYRWWAYAVYVIIPMILAALAFADDGYVDLGAYCYLPRDHGWARLALSWVPRYILLAFIVITYLCIYIYVRTSIRDYDRTTSTTTTDSSMTGSARPLAVLGRAKRPRPVHFHSSYLSDKSIDERPQPPRRLHCPIHRKVSHYQYGVYPSNREHPPADAQDSQLASLSGLARSLSVLSPETRPSSATAVADSPISEGRKPSLEEATNGAALGPAPVMKKDAAYSPSSSPQEGMPESRLSSTAGVDGPSLPCSDPSCECYEDPGSEVARNRERIRRQLRSLFIYPLIYTLTWLFPLINQVLGQTHGVHARPFWISCLSLAGFAIQGFANAVVFMVQEKPWRHKGDRGFWLALLGKLVLRSGGGRSGVGAGRTLDERRIEAHTAETRREGEMIDRTEAAALRGGPQSLPLRSSSRNWWDADLESDTEEEPPAGSS